MCHGLVSPQNYWKSIIYRHMQNFQWALILEWRAYNFSVKLFRVPASAKQYTGIVIKLQYEKSKLSNLPKLPISLCCIKVPVSDQAAIICLLQTILLNRLSFVRRVNKCTLHLVTPIKLLYRIFITAWRCFIHLCHFLLCMHAVQSFVLNHF